MPPWIARGLAPLLLAGACSFPGYRVDDGTGGGNTPVSATCTDGALNGSEGDVDCGGTCPSRCGTDKRCKLATDCESLVCLGQCQAPTCLDGVRNGLETGQDCGGPCPSCADGNACNKDGDCRSASCKDGICVGAGCADGSKNGEESDLDCGGSQCAPCTTDKHCKQNDDCESRVCSEQATCSAATCSDTVQNEQESAIDCGGPSCPPCKTGSTCAKASDCESALCQNGLCVPANPNGQPLSSSGWSIQTSEAATEADTAKALDGDDNTCWSSGTPQYDGMYVQLDLGEPRIFFKILIKVTATTYDQDYPTALDVYLSNDGAFGDPAGSASQGSQWTWIDFQQAQVGRYVRLQVTKAGPRPWSIGDIVIYQ